MRILIAISFELNPSLLCESQLVQMLAVLLHLTTAGINKVNPARLEPGNLGAEAEYHLKRGRNVTVKLV